MPGHLRKVPGVHIDYPAGYVNTALGWHPTSQCDPRQVLSSFDIRRLSFVPGTADQLTQVTGHRSQRTGMESG